MKLVFWAGGALGVVALLLLLALWLGGPAKPGTMSSIAREFAAADYSGLPELSFFRARDGVRLAYRSYAPPAGRSPVDAVVLVHGSSATSSSMHPLARWLAGEGHTVYALDVRGHGASGSKGHIGYIGQLEDDLEDFVAQVHPASPRTLIGFSSGGGFALRFAADPRKTEFQNYVLLSPFVHQDSPSQRPDSGGWVRVGLPRLAAVALLDGLGLTIFNGLPVTRFAVAPENRDLLTETYDYALSSNFRPHNDYRSDLHNATQPMTVIAGNQDEAFHTDKLGSVFQEAPGLRGVEIVPGIDHAGITLQPQPLKVIAAALARNAKNSNFMARDRRGPAMTPN